jgi:hypothetical protein
MLRSPPAQEYARVDDGRHYSVEVRRDGFLHLSEQVGEQPAAKVRVSRRFSTISLPPAVVADAAIVPAVCD